MTQQITFHFPVQSGIPCPQPHTRPHTRPNARKYPLRQMEIGDSFFIPSLYPAGLYSCIRIFKDRLYVSRRVTEDGVHGLRVWRLK